MPGYATAAGCFAGSNEALAAPAATRVPCRELAADAIRVSAITGGGDRSLEEGQKVEFDITQGQKGPQSENVRVTG